MRAGTRAQANRKDATVTLHYNANVGSNADCEPVADQSVIVLGDSQPPTKVSLTGTGVGTDTAVRDGSGVVAPKDVNAADGSGTTVSKIGDLGSAADIAGRTFEVYAIYEVVV